MKLHCQMIGPYEIVFNGHTYYGNVTLKEYHITERNGNYCLFLVENMVAKSVNLSLVKDITDIIQSPGALISDDLMQSLRKYDLVLEEEIDETTFVVPNKSAPRPVVQLVLFLTQTCNLNCVYCYGNGGDYGKTGIMTIETALAAVDWLMENSFDAKKVQICFFGGEPLMNFPLLKQVVIYAKTQARKRLKKVKFSITTNATLLTNQAISFLKAENIEPLISFDGSSELQNRQRPFKDGRGSHHIVYANVQKLRSVFPNLMGRATVCNGSDPFVIQKGMKDAGFSICFLSPANPTNLCEAESIEDMESHLSSEKRMVEYIRKEISNLFADITNRRINATTKSGVMALLAGLVERRKRHGGCGAGRGMRAISVDGGIYPCHRFVAFEDTRFGHIHDYRAGDINDYHRAAVENLPACRACWVRYFCGGGCFYNNNVSTGNMLQPNPDFCHDEKTVFDDLVHGWCMLNETDKNWLRAMLKC